MNEQMTETEMRRVLAKEHGLEMSSDPRSTREIAIAYGVIAVEQEVQIVPTQPTGSEV